jgi:hypothetical protein
LVKNTQGLAEMPAFVVKKPARPLVFQAIPALLSCGPQVAGYSAPGLI